MRIRAGAAGVSKPDDGVVDTWKDTPTAASPKDTPAAGSEQPRPEAARSRTHQDGGES